RVHRAAHRRSCIRSRDARRSTRAFAARPEVRNLMARTPKAAAPAPSTMKELKDTLWKAADKLRGSMDASQYKDVILGLVFLKYVSDAFDDRRATIRAELSADGYDEEQIADLIDDIDEYTGRG